MAYVIGEACVDVKDKTCVGECPVDCIYEGPRSLYIHPDECIDCGACEATCPVTAIAYEDDIALGPALVEQSRVWVELHGASGGAKRFGPVDTDHPAVAAKPVG